MAGIRTQNIRLRGKRLNWLLVNEVIEWDSKIKRLGTEWAIDMIILETLGNESVVFDDIVDVLRSFSCILKCQNMKKEATWLNLKCALCINYSITF